MKTIIKFDSLDLTQVAKLSQAGHTKEFIASFFGIDQDEFKRWMLKHPSLVKALEVKDPEKVKNVESCLYHRAIGYSLLERKVEGVDDKTGLPIVDSKVKQLPPDMDAIKFYLTNKDPEKWKNRRDTKNEHDIKGELATRLLRARRRLKNAHDDDMDFLE